MWRAVLVAGLVWASGAGAQQTGISKAILTTQAAGYQSTLQVRCKIITPDQAEDVLAHLEQELVPFSLSVQNLILRQYAMGQQTADREYFAFPDTCAQANPGQIEIIRNFASGSVPIINEFIEPTRR